MTATKLLPRNLFPFSTAVHMEVSAVLFFCPDIRITKFTVKEVFALSAAVSGGQGEYRNLTTGYAISHTRLLPCFSRAFLYFFQISFGEFACHSFPIVLVAERGKTPAFCGQRKEVRT
ncbi:hypothetical protein [Eubacterium sp. 1001713B170207_170306_E7]|uniref:hypothetical protein n=1 Tax=Eubacterium sp. 1001713B170207_170306_E7 TaxID=2787097 RepID=UPI00189BC2FE|nr:hypothetical protein [Eubacterium sp. 1001713B170207_170306_E7]